MTYNKESQDRRSKAYHARHPGKRDAWDKAYYAAHREEIAAKRAMRRAAVKDDRSAYSKAYRAANREKIAARTKIYVEANREKVRANARRWHARKKANGGQHTVDEWHALCAWFGNVCLCCGTSMFGKDHVVPLSNGGTDNITNLQPLCKPCNSTKSDKAIDYRDPARLAAFLEQL